MPRPAGCCRCAHRRRASPLTCLAVCFLVLSYTLLGAFLFLALEGGAEPAPPAGGELRARTVERLWAITEDLNILYRENWTELAARELLDFERALAETARALPDRGPRRRWTFSGSFLYALTLITTIGHGGAAPRSAAGKLVSVAYSCVGIPIVMLYLSTVGGALARNVRALYGRARPPRARPAPPPLAAALTPFQAALNATAGDEGGAPPPACREHGRVPLALGVLPAALYVALGTLVFRATERWSLVDGCYFSFASLATIGFGELRPGRHASSVSARAEDAAVGVCCLYILVGVAVVATCFDLLQREAGAALRGAAALCAGGARAVHGVDGEPPGGKRELS